MSILLFDQTGTDVLLVSDTLVVGDNYDPVMFQTKLWPLPHLNMVIASTGTANIARTWNDCVTSMFGPDDIEGLNTEAPRTLRAIAEELTNQYGPLGSSTIYHFGFPAGSDKPVRYTYRSANGFEPERFEGPQFGAKPTPPGFKLNRPAGPEEYIDLAHRLRDENERLRDTGGVPIGGDLFATLIENGSIRTIRWHRFPDYDEHRRQMLQHAAAAFEGRD